MKNLFKNLVGKYFPLTFGLLLAGVITIGYLRDPKLTPAITYILPAGLIAYWLLTNAREK